MRIQTIRCMTLRPAFFLTILFWVLLFVSVKAQYTVESVPNPKHLPGKGWVSDPKHFLTSQEVKNLNSKISRLERQTTAQVAVVVLKSIGKQNARDFGVALFRRWGIGQKQKDNGLLLLVVMEPHRWEFITGYGLEGDLPDATTSRIGHQALVPFFKKRKYGKGILAAIDEVEKILVSGSRVGSVTEAGSDDSVDTSQAEVNTLFDAKESNKSMAIEPVAKEKGFADIRANNIAFVFLVLQSFLLLAIMLFRKKQTARRAASWEGVNFAKYPQTSPYIPSGLLLVLLLGVSLLLLFNQLSDGMVYAADNIVYNGLVLYGELLLFFVFRRWFHNQGIATITDSYKRFKAFVKGHNDLPWLAIFFPLPFLLYIAWYFLERHRLRHVPRINPRTGLPLLKLSEEADDAHLSKGQLKEEKLGSVDYDVWTDPETAKVEVLGYDAMLTSYTTCVGCGFKTGYLHSDVTIRSATYTSSGVGEKIYACKNCSHSERKRYTIPQKQRSRSSSSHRSGGGSSGGISFGGGSTGGGSSGGSSFGGGSTGGGGSGGSW